MDRIIGGLIMVSGIGICLLMPTALDIAADLLDPDFEEQADPWDYYLV